MSDRNEWFKDVKRLVLGLEVETVEDPFAWPTVTSVADGEDVLYALGLHPSRVEPYWDMFPCEVLDRAPEWDGHTPDDAIWRASCDEGVVRVDEMHLIRPDTFGALMNDIDAAMDRPLTIDEPTRAYNVISGTCKTCHGTCGKLCQVRALHSICHRIHSLLAGDGE